MTDVLQALVIEVLGWDDISTSKHFDKTAYKRANRIFLTIDDAQEVWCVKLSTADQDLFCLFDRGAVFPVPNRWGAQGWTNIRPTNVPMDTLRDLLLSAWRYAADHK